METQSKSGIRLSLWKQKLLHARAEWYLKNHVAARDFGVPLPPIYSDKNTNELTKSICAWLKYNEHYANRINTQGQIRFEKVNLVGGRTYSKPSWTKGTTNRGTADVSAIIYGQHIAIEVKCRSTNDKIRPEQLKEKKRIEAAGGIYYVAADMQSFVEWYEVSFSKDEITLNKN